jgi:hypothetical protein
VRSILCRSFFEGDVFGGVKQIVARYPAATMVVTSTMELSDSMMKTRKRKGRVICDFRSSGALSWVI